MIDFFGLNTLFHNISPHKKKKYQSQLKSIKIAEFEQKIYTFVTTELQDLMEL